MSVDFPRTHPDYETADGGFFTDVETRAAEYVIEKINEAGGFVSSGGSGVSPFIFHQTVPSDSWILVHELGRYPASVSVYDDTGERRLTEVSNPDLNTTVVSFLQPMTGSVVIT